MKVLTSEQVRLVDAYTIAHEPIASTELMERAAQSCYDWLADRNLPGSAFYLFCGPGNNGGDGLALARMLYDGGFAVRVFVVGSDTPSRDHFTNLERLRNLLPGSIEPVLSTSDLPKNLSHGIIVDALFGTGLTRPLTGLFRETVLHLNQSRLPIISIDMPSGLMSDSSSVDADGAIIRASVTLTFQFLKKAHLVGENQSWCGIVEILDIGILPEAIASMDVKMHVTGLSRVIALYRRRPDFSHKGTFGHVLLFAGSKGKTGAAILAAGGCLRSGSGLLSLLLPSESIPIVQTAVPEAMAEDYKSVLKPGFIDTYTTVGSGPGIGTGHEAASILRTLLQHVSKPVVLDADAINLMAIDPSILELVPENSILTPHPGEFRRIVGKWNNDFEKLDLQLDYAVKHKVHLILKGKNTTIATPSGHLWFNPTGNAGMAKGGSGDILTGLLTGLLASGYPPLDACILGTWVHGKAGDISSDKFTQEATTAGDLVRNLGEAWKLLTIR